VIEVRSQLLKALLPILVTELGITVFRHPLIKVFEDVSIIALLFSLLSYTEFPASTLIEEIWQPEKAASSTLVTELGIAIEVRLSHPEKAITPILVTDFGIVIEVRL
jgi:hypothetical protein